MHSHTFQNSPLAAVAALEVKKIIQEDKLVNNVNKLGLYLGGSLKAILGDHPNVGDIRGLGFFWGIEFVQDKYTKKPFHNSLKVAERISNKTLSHPYNMSLYYGQGCPDGVNGDHNIIAPPYITNKKDINVIVNTIYKVVNKFFIKI